jgi:hypothetical protein
MGISSLRCGRKWGLGLAQVVVDDVHIHSFVEQVDKMDNTTCSAVAEYRISVGFGRI